ncbi:hypothetical protein CLOM_g4730 [Closterium sp. NIES-68]|nr:hypothetical protein CLOM_g4730 [Closterium sp. NIES-68]
MSPLTLQTLQTHSPDITAHATDVTTHSPDVTAHATDVTTHSPDVTAHTADLTTPSPDLTAHSADITTHSPDVAARAAGVTTLSPDVAARAAGVTTHSPDVTAHAANPAPTSQGSDVQPPVVPTLQRSNTLLWPADGVAMSARDGIATSACNGAATSACVATATNCVAVSACCAEAGQYGAGQQGAGQQEMEYGQRSASTQSQEKPSQGVQEYQLPSFKAYLQQCYQPPQQQLQQQTGCLVGGGGSSNGRTISCRGYTVEFDTEQCSLFSVPPISRFDSSSACGTNTSKMQSDGRSSRLSTYCSSTSSSLPQLCNRLCTDNGVIINSRTIGPINRVNRINKINGVNWTDQSHPTDPIDGHNSMVSSGSSMSIVSNISSINGCFMDPWPDTYTAAIGQHLEAPSAAGVCLDDLYLVPDDVTKVPGGIGNMRECQVIIGFGDSDLMHLFAAHGCDDMDLVLFDCSC